MNKLVTALLSVVIVTSGTATFARGGWQQSTKITQFIIEGSPAGERIYVLFENNFNPDECTGNNTEWVRIFGDTEKGKYLFTSVLSAKATGQAVTPFLYGCDDWGRPVLTGLWVQ